MAVENQPEISILPTPLSATRGIAGMRVAFVGKLGGLNRREARKFVREQNGVMVDSPSDNATLIVIGADELPSSDYEQLLDDFVIAAASEGVLQIINETEFWQQTGIIDSESEEETCQLYTPAMLAELLDISISTIRRWQRIGLIKPTRQVNKLPYFDFQEVSSARRIARLIESGKSPQIIEKKLQQLSQLTPELERPLSQLSILVEGREVLLRKGEGLIEPGGQKRIDFDRIENQEAEVDDDNVAVINIESPPLDINSLHQFSKPEEYFHLAQQCEDSGETETAAQVYRAMSLAFGPNPEVCFRLGELLYLVGQYEAARERYYMAVELDESYVEARASLGCVLVELNEPEMAVSAFRGALEFHSDYPDVHFHLARLLDDIEHPAEAEIHWQRFLELSPKSPWADEARDRLQD